VLENRFDAPSGEFGERGAHQPSGATERASVSLKKWHRALACLPDRNCATELTKCGWGAAGVAGTSYARCLAMPAVRSTLQSRHPALTAFAAQHAADEDELVERLYYLRKLRNALEKATAKPGEVISPPALATTADATQLELLRLSVEEPVSRTCARVPTYDDLITLGGGLAFANQQPSVNSFARNVRTGWLLFSYGGIPDIIEQALHHFSALTLALALRSRDPPPK